MTASWAAELPASALACAGRRICEAVALTCGDADLAGSMLTSSLATQRTRLVPLHPRVRYPECGRHTKLASFEATSISVWFGDRKV